MRLCLLILAAVFLFAAFDASAQCQRCEWVAGCVNCAHTFYNSYQECQIDNTGYSCTLTGTCEGDLGEACGRCAQEKVEARPLVPKLRGEWQLVSVEIIRPAQDRKRRS